MRPYSEVFNELFMALYISMFISLKFSLTFSRLYPFLHTVVIYMYMCVDYFWAKHKISIQYTCAWLVTDHIITCTPVVLYMSILYVHRSSIQLRITSSHVSTNNTWQRSTFISIGGRSMEEGDINGNWEKREGEEAKGRGRQEHICIHQMNVAS